MSIHDCEFLPLSRIRPTEEVSTDRVNEVVAMILDTKSWTLPICIEATIGALLDGHHRLAAARLLGLSRVPVHVFDYAEVTLASWRPDFAPTREDVLARARSGELYPYKTTRHIFSARIMRPIRMADLIHHCCETPQPGETALGSGLLFQQTDMADEMRRRMSQEICQEGRSA